VEYCLLFELLVTEKERIPSPDNSLIFLVFVFKITRNSNATIHIYRIFMYALCNFGQNYQTPINAAVSYMAI